MKAKERITRHLDRRAFGKGTSPAPFTSHWAVGRGTLRMTDVWGSADPRREEASAGTGGFCRKVLPHYQKWGTPRSHYVSVWLGLPAAVS